MVNVFLSVAGQNDNLGDSVLRRGLLESFQGEGRQLHVHIGSNDDDYLSAVGLNGEEVLYRSPAEWSRVSERSLLSTTTFFGFNAGEVQVSSARAHLGWRAFARVLASKPRSGGAFHVGVGIRTPGEGSPSSLRALLRTCDLVTWRDSESQASTGIGSVAPDWAFALGGPGRVATVRDQLVVSLRDDRQAPTDAWIETVSRTARELSTRITVFSQVRRDNERAAQVASRLGPETGLVTWGSGTHAQWEQTARNLYARSVGVVSDRLHALVIGATEGAVPLGMTTGDPEKLKRTLGTAGLAEFAFRFDDERDAARRLIHLAKRADDVGSSIEEARRRLAEVRARIDERIG
jgi:hypothetical protein